VAQPVDCRQAQQATGCTPMPIAPKSIGYRKPRRRPERRASSAKRGYDRRWQDFRRVWLAEQFAAGHVYCAWCGKLLDGDSKSIHVDHKTPHNGDLDLMYDTSNLAPMHARCHSVKTVKLDGGFRGKTGTRGGVVKDQPHG
jgi:5-methylcytosine-specific restriction endonuclease McrA